MKKKKKRIPQYPTKVSTPMESGVNGMTYADHLNKQREKEGLEPLTESEVRSLRYQKHISIYDL